MEASSKSLMNWKTAQKSFNPIRKSIKGTHGEEKTKEDSPNYFFSSKFTNALRKVLVPFSKRDSQDWFHIEAQEKVTEQQATPIGH